MVFELDLVVKIPNWDLGFAIDSRYELLDSVDLKLVQVCDPSFLLLSSMGFGLD